MWNEISTETTKDIGNKLNAYLNSNNYSFLNEFLDITKLFSYKFICQKLISETVYIDISKSPFSSVIRNLLLFPLSQQPDIMKYINAYSEVIQIEEIRKNDVLYCTLVKTISKSLFIIGQNFDYEKAVKCFGKLIKSTMPKQKSLNESPFIGTLNCLFNLYFTKNNFKFADKQLKSLEGKFALINLDVCSSNELACFYFNRGKIDVIFSRYRSANDNLSSCLTYVSPMEIENRRLIFAFFVPLQLCFGCIPKDGLTKKYSLHVYDDLIESVKNGDLSLYEKTLDENQLTFIRLGVWELVVHIRPYVERRIIEMIQNRHPDKNIIDIELIRLSFSYFVPNITIDEVEFICSKLISKGLMKACIFHYRKKMVLANNNIFPNARNDFD